MTQRTESIKIHGMHCAGCEFVIENAVKNLPGISEVNADYTGDKVGVRYDNALTSLEMIVACIEKHGYLAELEIPSSRQKIDSITSLARKKHLVLRKAGKKSAVIILAIIGISFILWLDSWFMDHTDTPRLGRDISYGLLILIGFLTSFHCVGMCGPLILGYTATSVTRAVTCGY